MTLIVLNPTNGPVESRNKIAERKGTLNGSVIGLIDNGKKNSSTVLHAVADRLKQQFNIKETISITKGSFSHAIKDDDAERFARKCDFVLAGVGD